MAGEHEPGTSLPGTRLHAWLARVVSSETMQRIVSPVLADFQDEIRVVDSHGHLRLMATRVRWMGALATALILNFMSRPASPGERVQHRRLWTGVSMACVAVAVSQSVMILSQSGPAGEALSAGSPALAIMLLLYLLPSGLAVGIPCGVLLGALTCTPAAPGRRRPLALAGVVGSVIVLLLLAFVVPPSNQAYRVTAWRAISAAGVRAVPEKGVREMSFGELEQNAAKYRSIDRSGHAATYEVERHRRLALAAACVVLVWFAAGLAGTRLASSLARRLAVTAAVATLYVGLFGWGSYIATRVTVDSPAPVWIPNLVFLVLAAALQIARRRGGVPSVSRG